MPNLSLYLNRGGRMALKAAERSNEEWLDGLQGVNRGEYIAELRGVLLQGLRYGLRSTLGRKGALDMAEDFAQEGMMKVLDNLHTFRGESRFTTWAQKIALRVAYSEIRRKRWEDLSLDEMSESSREASQTPVRFRSSDPSPEDSAGERLILELVERVVREDLTDLQRQALEMIAMRGVPIEEVARHLDTNRNALYKLLHDARKKVKAVLERHGVSSAILAEELA